MRHSQDVGKRERAERAAARSSGKTPEMAPPDLERFCVRCGSDRHTRLRMPGDTAFWCDLCRDWQQQIPERIKYLCRLGLGLPGVRT